MPIESKEVILLLLGLIGPALVAIVLKGLGMAGFETFNSADTTIVITMIIALGFIITIFYKRFNEITEELDVQKLEQKKLGEKLNIYKRLSKIEEIVFKDVKI